MVSAWVCPRAAAIANPLRSARAFPAVAGVRDDLDRKIPSAVVRGISAVASFEPSLDDDVGESPCRTMRRITSRSVAEIVVRRRDDHGEEFFRFGAHAKFI
jgi:hypothetical protein